MLRNGAVLSHARDVFTPVLCVAITRPFGPASLTSSCSADFAPADSSRILGFAKSSSRIIHSLQIASGSILPDTISHFFPPSKNTQLEHFIPSAAKGFSSM